MDWTWRAPRTARMGRVSLWSSTNKALHNESRLYSSPKAWARGSSESRRRLGFLRPRQRRSCAFDTTLHTTHPPTSLPRDKGATAQKRKVSTANLPPEVSGR